MQESSPPWLALLQAQPLYQGRGLIREKKARKLRGRQETAIETKISFCPDCFPSKVPVPFLGGHSPNCNCTGGHEAPIPVAGSSRAGNSCCSVVCCVEAIQVSGACVELPTRAQASFLELLAQAQWLLCPSPLC